LTRRRFLGLLMSGATACGALSCGSALGSLAAYAAPGRSYTLVNAGPSSFACLTAAGTPRQIGLAVGTAFGREIREGMERRSRWIARLKEYAEGKGRHHLDTMLQKAREFAPRVVEELEGWAEGSGISFRDLFILNCNNELDTRLEEDKKPPGDCSTAALKTGGKLLIAHNEDGNGKYSDLMWVLHAIPDDAPEFICLAYPGFIEGNAPAFNSCGIAITTNYIGTREVKDGIPRYFISRMMLEARTAEEALATACHAERAYGYHHIVASLPEGRAWGVEVTPSKSEKREIEGLYLHTNHLVFEGLRDTPQFEKYNALSSIPRYQSLQKLLGSVSDISSITKADIIKAMSSHEGKPYSLCRHPEGEAEGATVGMAFFESRHGKEDFQMELYANNPCKGRKKIYRLAEQGKQKI